MPQHENVRKSKVRAVKQARPKAIDFLSGSEDDPDYGDESSDQDPEDRNEEDNDVPRVARWIDEEELDLQHQTGDASASLDSEGADDDDRSANEAGPSRRLVGDLRVIRLRTFPDSYFCLC